jgi:hypothetical protein
MYNLFCHRTNGNRFVDRDTANGKPPGLMRMDRLAAGCSGETTARQVEDFPEQSTAALQGA